MSLKSKNLEEVTKYMVDLLIMLKFSMVVGSLQSGQYKILK